MTNREFLKQEIEDILSEAVNDDYEELIDSIDDLEGVLGVLMAEFFE